MLQDKAGAENSAVNIAGKVRMLSPALSPVFDTFQMLWNE